MRLAALALAAISLARPTNAASAPRPRLSPAATAVVLSPFVRIGAIDPSVSRGQDGEMRIVVRSGSPWQLALAPRSGSAGVGVPASVPALRGAAPTPASAELAVRSSSGLLCPLTAPGMVPVAAGGPTPPGGALLSLPVVASVRPTAPPGPRCMDLDVVLDGRRTGASVRVEFEVAERLQLVQDPRPFELSRAPDPTRAGLWRFDKRTYRVVSNVAWIVQVALDGAPKEAVASRTLRQNAIVVLSDGQPSTPLAPGQPATIASGPATGEGGTEVEVDLGLAVTGGEVQGDYSASLAVTARPAPPVEPTGVVKTAGQPAASERNRKAGE